MALPSLCTVCITYTAECVVPDRHDDSFPFRFDVMCIVCLDEFLSMFPLRPSDIAKRETEGRWSARVARR